MTTTKTLPAAWAPLHAALRARRPVTVSYHGRHRIVCPHALGWKNDRALVLAYQTGGQTSTGTLPADPRQRWRCMYIDEIDDVDTVDPAQPWATAENYNHTRPFPAIDHLTIAITPNDTDTVR
jgi:predicted DNA-binding transcriptional regulator YafY